MFISSQENIKSYMANLVAITSLEHLMTLVEVEPKIIILEFTATWCHACHKLLETFQALDPTKVVVYQVDVDLSSNLRLRQLQNITSLPTVVFIHRGRFVDTGDFRIEGYDPVKLKTCLSQLGYTF